MSLKPLPDTPEEWHAMRLTHIGGSEIASLFGLQAPYQPSLFALHHIKAQRIAPPPVEGERIEFGLELEAPIVRIGARRFGWVVHSSVYAEDDTCPGAGATLDRIIEAGPEEIALGMTGRGVCEAKNVDAMVFRQSWIDGEPPFHILLQLQHQLACSGLPWGVIIAAIGGNELRCWRYWADADLIADIRRRVAAFWEAVRRGAAPDVDGAESTAYALRALFPEVIDDAVDMTANNEWGEAVASFLDAAKTKKAATESYDEAKNRLALLLGEHKRAYGGGYSVSVSVTAEKPHRVATPGEIIKGRAESRRFIAKEKAA